MKIPAIRAHINNLRYYVSCLTFSQINQFVEIIDVDENGKNFSENQFLDYKFNIINECKNSLLLAVLNGKNNFSLLFIPQKTTYFSVLKNPHKTPNMFLPPSYIQFIHKKNIRIKKVGFRKNFKNIDPPAKTVFLPQ